MNREEKLAEANRLEDEARRLRAEAIQEQLAEQQARPLADRLIYAATSRCPCGAGLAYDPVGPSGGVGNEGGVFKYAASGYWDCSAILLGTATPKGQPGSVQHTGKLPFAFYEIKSEEQPSACGATTRPGRESSL